MIESIYLSIVVMLSFRTGHSKFPRREKSSCPLTSWNDIMPSSQKINNYSCLEKREISGLTENKHEVLWDFVLVSSSIINRRKKLKDGEHLHFIDMPILFIFSHNRNYG